MSLSGQLQEAMAAPEWRKTADGYEMDTKKGKALLKKKGKALSSPWVLVIGKKMVDLGKRASFDKAEGALVKMGAL